MKYSSLFFSILTASLSNITLGELVCIVLWMLMRTRNKVTNIVILPGITSGFIRKLEIIHNEGLCCPLFIIGNCSLSQLFVWQKIQSSIFVRVGEASGLFPSSYFMFESPFYYKMLEWLKKDPYSRNSLFYYLSFPCSGICCCRNIEVRCSWLFNIDHQFVFQSPT